MFESWLRNLCDYKEWQIYGIHDVVMARCCLPALPYIQEGSIVRNRRKYEDVCEATPLVAL
jgi:hypothetical protein